LITATSDGFANIWSTDIPKLLKRYSLFTSAGAIQTIKVFGSIGSPDYEGNFLLMAATHQNTHLRLFDLKNGDLLHEFTMTSTEGQFSSLAIDQKSSTVFLSNTARPSIIGLHIRSPQASELICCESTKDYLLSSTQNIDTRNCRFGNFLAVFDM
jgi:WD40 repeat protein